MNKYSRDVIMIFQILAEAKEFLLAVFEGNSLKNKRC